jgi:ABC-2 type transport system permease protein
MAVAHDDTKGTSALLYRKEDSVSHRDYHENSTRLLVSQSVVLTKRLLIRWGRDRMTVIEALILPIVFLVTLNIVLGQKVSSITGHSALYGTVPMSALNAATTASTVGAIGIVRERADGLLSRLWVLPTHRASGLVSRIVAASVECLVTTVAILCAGLILGLRFQQGAFATVAWFFVPVVFGLATVTLVTTGAFYLAEVTLVEAETVVRVLAMLFSTGFLPLSAYPRWIQPVVQLQPMTYSIEAMRGLSLGGPVLWPTVGMLAWCGGITGVFVLPMVLGYRRASMRE